MASSDEEEVKNGLLGQKHPTPTPGNGDRVFYESLLKQRPDSEMALQWCLEYGVLSEKKAKKAHERLLKSKAEKGTSPKRSSSSSKKKKTKKEKKVLDDVMVDAGMDVGGGDGIGIAGL